MTTARDLIAQRFDKDEVLRKELRDSYRMLREAIESGQGTLTLEFDTVEQANVVSHVLVQEFGFCEDYTTNYESGQRKFSLLYYEIVQGDSPFAKFLEDKVEYTDEDKVRDIKKGIDTAIEDYLERSGQSMFHIITLSPKNFKLFSNSLGTTLYKSGVVVGNERYDDNTVAIGGYGALLEGSVKVS